MKHNSGGNLRSTTLKLSFPGTAFVEMNKEKKEKESQQIKNLSCIPYDVDKSPLSISITKIKKRISTFQLN